jgi:hypothetical protein
MSIREASTFHAASLAGCALLGTLAVACGGGSGFTSSVTDGGAPAMNESDAGGVVVIVGSDSEATSPVDAGAGTPAVGADAQGADGQIPMGAADAAVDAPPEAGPSCTASELACNGQCVSIDTSHCGSCATACPAPSGGAATCTLASGAYACGISCNASLSHCGGACVDTQNDRNNCGRCGHSCVAGDCVAGECQSWTVASASVNNAGLSVFRAGTLGHVDIATDGTSVVWIDRTQGVLQASATAGTSAPVVNLSPMQQSSTVSPASLAMAHGVVVWTLSDVANGVSLWAATEGAPNSGVQIASLGAGSAGDLPSGLALDATGSTAYFFDSENNSGYAPQFPGLYKCVLANKTCSVLYAATVPSYLTAANDVAMANGILYWTDSAGGSVSRANYATNAIGTVVTNQVTPCLLATDASYVYWAGVTLTSGASPTSAGFAIARLSSTGGASTVLPGLVGSLMGMATDGNYMYFAHNTSSQIGQLDYVPVDGSVGPTPLKAGQQAYGLAVGGGAIYWLNGDNTIDGIAAP